jgi:hypothetical protein
VPDTKIRLQGSSKIIMTATTVKNSDGNGKAKDAKVEVKKQEPKAADQIISLEKRIRKVEELNIVIEKWRKLNEARKNLTGFQLGNDGLSAQITLRDSTGQEFKTSHSLVVNTVLETLQSVVDERIRECEDQIKFED